MFVLMPVEDVDLPIFKRDMQEAFQIGAEAECGKTDDQILPESHIDKSLSAKGSTAWKAVVDGEMVGGAIVVVNGKRGHLDFLYVKYRTQSKGIGQKIWKAIEKKYPKVEVWETCTPYFEKRNLHFYINRLGFAAVEFYNPMHPDPNAPDDGEPHDGNPEEDDYFFRFEKRM